FLQHLQGPETNVLQGPNVLSQEGLNVFDNAWKNNNGEYYFDHALMMNANVQGQLSLSFLIGNSCNSRESPLLLVGVQLVMAVEVECGVVVVAGASPNVEPKV
ncbi:hypothetical protein Tco_1418877, partial [Tanacetum coccineum]